MSLYAIGLNHQTAPLVLRERVAFAADALTDGLRDLFGKRLAREAAILSTCNRTEIGSASISMAAASVKLARRIFPTLEETHMLLIGAGEMIELAATHFAAANPASITVANRTLSRGEALAAKLGASAITLAELPE